MHVLASFFKLYISQLSHLQKTSNVRLWCDNAHGECVEKTKKVCKKQINMVLLLKNMGRGTGGGHWGTVPPHFCKNQENVPFLHWGGALFETFTRQLFTLVAMLNTLGWGGVLWGKRHKIYFIQSVGEKCHFFAVPSHFLGASAAYA